MNAGATIQRTLLGVTALLSIEGGQEFLGIFDSEAEAVAACVAAQERYAFFLGERKAA